ncbi:MAG: YqjF family protein [Terracidiphilus sp.]
MQEYLIRTSRRPRPLPPGRWVTTQRWNDLLLAHWPVPAPAVQALLPEGVEADTFQGSAWVGMVPFWLDRIKFRGVPSLPGLRRIPDLNLRTYVRERETGAQGIYCFSIDASSLVAVAAARTIFHLPYYWAEMRLEQRSEREFSFYSRRRFASQPVMFNVRYRGLGPTSRLAEIPPGSLEYFLTERYCLFTRNHNGQPVRANIHRVPSPLEEAEAEIERNDLPTAIGIELPNTPPVLHYLRRLAVYIWPGELMRPALARRPVAVAATPS